MEGNGMTKSYARQYRHKISGETMVQVLVYEDDEFSGMYRYPTLAWAKANHPNLEVRKR